MTWCHNSIQWCTDQRRIFNGPVLLLRSDAVASRSVNGSTAFIWKLCCHWLGGLWQRHIAVIIQAPGPTDKILKSFNSVKISLFLLDAIWHLMVLGHQHEKCSLESYTYILGSFCSYKWFEIEMLSYKTADKLSQNLASFWSVLSKKPSILISFIRRRQWICKDHGILRWKRQLQSRSEEC